jgi:hypothetical protein
VREPGSIVYERCMLSFFVRKRESRRIQWSMARKKGLVRDANN